MSTRLGICLPYGHQEATYLGLVLGQFALSRGIPVSLLSWQPQGGVDPVWDGQVQDGRKIDFYEWGRRRTHLVWFDFNRSRLGIAKLLGCHNTFVFSWTRMDAAQLEALDDFDQVVAPHEAARAMLGKYNINASTCPWDSGQPQLARSRARQPGDPLRVYIPLDGASARRLGVTLFSALSLLLMRLPRLRVTLGHIRSWPGLTHLAIHDLLREHPKRVTVVRNQNRRQHLSQFELHDWTFWPAVHSIAGLTALESLSANVPVVTFRVAPFLAALPACLQNYSLQCGVEYNSWGLPRVKKPSLVPLVDQLEQLFSRPILPDMPGAAVELQQRRDAFEQTWLASWASDKDS